MVMAKAERVVGEAWVPLLVAVTGNLDTQFDNETRENIIMNTKTIRNMAQRMESVVTFGVGEAGEQREGEEHGK